MAWTTGKGGGNSMREDSTGEEGGNGVREDSVKDRWGWLGTAWLLLWVGSEEVTEG